MRLRLFLVSLLSVATFAQQAPAKETIYLARDGSDSAGSQFAYQLREEITRSSRYELSPVADGANYEVRLVTIEVPCDHAPVAFSTVSMLIVAHYGKSGGELLIGHELFFTAADIQGQQARSAMASLDERIRKSEEAFIKAFESAPKRNSADQRR